MPQTESALIQACKKGNPGAWDEFVDRYGRLVYSIPHRYGLDVDSADEVFQNVFTIVFRQLDHLRDPKAVVAWLITITRRESILYCKKFRSPLELDENTEDPSGSLPEMIQRWERQHYIHQALERLGSPCRELIKAIFLEDPAPSYEELARRFQMPAGSIGPTRGRCLRKLEVILLEMGIDLDS